MAKLDISAMNPEELQSFVKRLGEPPFRVVQIFDWLHAKRVTDFGDMSNLSKDLKARLAEQSTIVSAKEVDRWVSADGTVKFLFAMADGSCIETVAMRYHHGISVCVSSQVGCRMGCRFCASTVNGLERNLSASEILAQVYAVDRLLGERVDSIVMMGIGEPLDNFDNVLRFYELITEEKGYNLSGRSVSLSTCGLVDKIYELADLKKQLTLSVSLHAPNDEKRSAVMPVNNRYPVEQLMEACRYYSKTTGRRISYEYSVIHGNNDSDADAKDLARLLQGTGAHVNLIPVNPAVRADFRATRNDAESFRKKLEALGINATIRRTLGTDISAACGQLRRQHIDASSSEE